MDDPGAGGAVAGGAVVVDVVAGGAVVVDVVAGGAVVVDVVAGGAVAGEAVVDIGSNIEVESSMVEGCKDVAESVVTVSVVNVSVVFMGLDGVIPSSRPSRYVNIHNTMTKNKRNNEAYIFIPNIFCKTILYV